MTIPMPGNDDDAYFYHSMASALFGDQRALGKVRREHDSWKEAYCELAESGVVLQHADSAREELREAGIRVVLADDARFPARLREIPYPPHALYVKGDPAAVTQTGQCEAAAIVGTRRATPGGKELARRFGRELAGAGCAIVSGLAFGIDAAAHEGWLEAGTGSGAVTRGVPAVAVLAGGLRSVYPGSHAALARKIIAAGGALVSEYPLSESPLPRRFIERNRIVSGLARGAVIIEAPDGSGALSTARFALEQDRDVFVLPGNVDQPNYRGSNRLIRHGAELVTSPEDILESYGMVKGPTDRAEQYGAADSEASLVLRAIAECIARDGILPDVDKISAAAKLEPRIVNRTLTFLIINDIVKEEPRGYTLT